MPDDRPVNFASPANQPILAHLRIDNPGEAVFTRAAEVHALKLGMSLGTHPDLVDYLWGLARDLPGECAGVINQRSSPILVNPTSGILFAMAGGTDTMAFRLPEPERSAAMAVPGYGAEYHYPHSVVRASSLGDDWALVKPFEKIIVAWCRRAYDYAGTLR